MLQQGDRLAGMPQHSEGLQGFVLMFLEFDNLALLSRQEIVEGQKTRNPLQKQGELLLDTFRLMGDLAIGPTEDLPTGVDEAVLLQQVVFVLRYGRGIRYVPGETIDLEGNPLVAGSQRVIDEAISLEDVLDRALREKKRDFSRPKTWVNSSTNKSSGILLVAAHSLVSWTTNTPPSLFRSIPSKMKQLPAL